MIGTAAAEARSGRRLKRYQALTLTLLVIGYSGYYLCRSDLSVSIPLIVAELGRHGIAPGSARVVLGTMASLGVLGYAIGKFVAGGLADFLGGRRNFLLGMAGSIVFTLLFAASGAVPIFTLAWIGNRMVQSLGWASAVKISSRWFSFTSYGTVMAIVSLSYLFGDAASREFMAMLIGAGLGWRAVFMIAAAVLAVILALCAWLLRESPREIGEEEPAINPANLFSSDGADSKPASLGALLRPLLGSGIFWLACILSLGTTILRETFGLWTPTYFTQVTGMSAAEAASRSALFPFFGGISVLLCGWLSDRLGRTGRAVILFSGLALATVALLAPGLNLMHGSRVWPVVVTTLIAFLIIGPYSFLAGAIALDFGGRRGSATASGFIDGVGYLGGVLSGDSVARISVAFGWSGAFLALAGVALLTSAAAALFLYHERRIAR